MIAWLIVYFGISISRSSSTIGMKDESLALSPKHGLKDHIIHFF